MKLRISIFIFAAVMAGLSWNLGSSFHITMLLITPLLLAFSVVFWLQDDTWQKQLLFLAGVIIFAEIVRITLYCFVLNGWHYLTSDPVTQAVSLLSFGSQILLAFVSFIVICFVIRLYKKKWPNHPLKRDGETAGVSE